MVLEGGGNIKQITVRISDETHRKLKEKTARDGIRIQDFISNHVDEYLKNIHYAENILGDALFYSEKINVMEARIDELEKGVNKLEDTVYERKRKPALKKLIKKE